MGSRDQEGQLVGGKMIGLCPRPPRGAGLLHMTLAVQYLGRTSPFQGEVWSLRPAAEPYAIAPPPGGGRLYRRLTERPA